MEVFRNVYTERTESVKIKKNTKERKWSVKYVLQEPGENGVKDTQGEGFSMG